MLAEKMSPRPAIVVTNPVVGALYLDEVMDSLSSAGFLPTPLYVPDGEVHKTVQTWQQLLDEMFEVGVGRKTPVLALGGGVTGDIVGFAAACALRGLPLIQIPTTLLAMVDSAVGGKTAVNSPRGKNLVGAFYQPQMVIADPETLRTLSVAEMRSGLGEVLKHALLQDPLLFELCEDNAEDLLSHEPAITYLIIERCCSIKASVVEADEKEQGLRAILNLGHTIGHAIETALGHGALRHGECVALGLLAETRWAAARGDCPDSLPERLEAVCMQLGIRTLPPDVDRGALMQAALHDKKMNNGWLTVPVLEDLGQVRIEQIPIGELEQMIGALFV